MKRYAHCLIAGIVFPIALLMPVLTGAQDTEGEGDVTTIYVGEMKRIATNTPTRVVVGNPVVADVFSVGTKEIVLAGKGAGMTNLLWWDGSGERSMRVKVLTEEMAYFKSRIDDLLKQMGFATVTAKPADAEGKVLLLGSVKTTADMNQIKTALGDMNKKIINLIAVDEEESTVELDVEVLEVDQDGRKQMGIEWPSSLELSEPGDFVKTLAKTPSSLVQISKWTHGTLTTKLDFLVQEGKARILSRPRLACQSGKEAELLVGGETPIMTTQVSGEDSSGTEVEYKEYGIKLKIAPVILADAKVKLSIAVEVSDISETALKLGASDAPTAIAYPLSKRNTSTQLVLNDNQTLAISGLIKQQTTEDVSKVPFLGDLPVIGLMFRHRDSKSGRGAGARGNTELVIMVTPKILKNGKARAPVSVSGSDVPAKPAPDALAEPVAQPVSEASAVPVTLTEKPKKDRGESLEDYVRRIGAYISGKIEYPSLAKMSGIEGTVKLSLHITRAGELLETSVSKSSGHAVLDADALNTAKEISPYPSFPKGISEKDIWVQVPISYRITAHK